MEKQQSREIRVFISSTFQDMNSERNELVSRIFPLLRKMAEERNVTLTEIDLRWGITKEESEDSRVVSICLEEIERSHPFFIGILGGRYGWTPSDSPVDWHSLLEDRYHDVADDIDKGLSMTEIEMLHGVFKSGDKPYAIFFVKEMDEALVEEKQKHLRDAVLAQTDYPVYTYANIEKMGELVVSEFETLLDQLYPKELVNGWESLVGQQTNILSHRLQTYVPRIDIEEKIMSFLETSKERYMLVQGESGMGKSSVIASVVLKLQQGKDKDVIAFFPTCATSGTSSMDVASWFCKGLQHIYGVRCDEHKSPVDQLQALASEIEPQNPLYLFVDGINQLSNDNGFSSDMSWWPDWRGNVKCVFSTADETPVLNRNQDISMVPLHVGRMHIDERIALANKYFTRFRKKLSQDQRDLLGNDNALYDNTMVFMSLLEQIRRYDSYENLTGLMQHMSQISSPTDFFIEVIRQQNTFGDEKLEKKFQQAMLVLLLSERGLPEDVMMGMLQMTRLELSKFISINDSYLITNGGLVVFGHDIYKSAIKQLYGNNESDVTECRKLIVDYLKTSEDSIRLTELSYQYSCLQDYDHLYKLVSDLVVFAAFKKQQRIHKIAQYWQQLLTINPYRYDIIGMFSSTPISADDILASGMQHYVDVITTSSNLSQLIEMVSTYLQMPDVSLRLQHAQEKLLENEEGYEGVRDALKVANANARAVKGEFGEALSMYYKEIDDNTLMSDFVIQSVGECFLKMYERYSDKQYLDIACNILESSLVARQKNASQISNKGLASAYANYGSALFYKDPEKSFEYQKKALDYYEKDGGHYNVDVAIQHHNISTQYLLCKDTEQALSHSQESLNIYKKLFGEDNQNTMQAHQALGYVYKAMGDLENSINELQIALQYTTDKPSLRDTRKTLLDKLFLLCYQADESEQSLEYGQTFLAMLQEEDPMPTEQIVQYFGNVGKTLYFLGRQEEARESYEDAISLAADNGLHKQELENIYYYASVLHDAGMSSDSDEYLTRLIELGESYGEEYGAMVAKGYFNRAVQRFNDGGALEQTIADIRKAISIIEDEPEENERDLNDYNRALKQLLSMSGKGSDADSDADNVILQGENDTQGIVAEMERYLNNDNKDILTCFSEGVDEFRVRHYDQAVYKFNLALNKMNDETPYSALAIVLRYLAYCKEMFLRSGSSSYSDEEITNDYDEAISYALDDDNHQLIQVISHDMAEYQWSKSCFLEAEYYYWIEIYHLSALNKTHSIEYPRALLNIAGALSRQEDKPAYDIFLHIYLLAIFCAQVPDVVDEKLLDTLYGQLNFVADQMKVDIKKLSLDFGEDALAVGEWMVKRSFDVHRCESDYLHDASAFSIPLLEIAINYFHQKKDEAKLCSAIYYRGHAARRQYDMATAVKLFENLAMRLAESDDTEFLEDTMYSLADAYLSFHDTERLQALIEKANLDPERIKDIEYEHTPCACMIIDNRKEEALSRLEEMEAKAKNDECSESEYYDLCLSNILLGRKYEAKRYLKLWQDSWPYFGCPVEDKLDPAYNRLSEMIEDIK